jgi:ribosomal protein S18 acetylase RimI-like enzyme
VHASAGEPVTGAPCGASCTLRTALPADAAAAAAMHGALITEGFLSSLGPRFLRLLYRRITRSPGSFLVLAEADAAAVGFIAGSVSVGRLYREFLARDGVRAAVSAPHRLVAAWPRALETLRHPRDGAVGPARAELLAVAVAPAWRGRQIGTRLVERFLDDVAERGAERAHVVVGADNAVAQAMYRQAGFTATRRFELHRGVTSVLMETDVPRATGSSGHGGA